MVKIVNETAILALIKKAPVYDTIYQLYGAPPNWSRPPGFISLAKIILEQQVSLESANAHFQKLNTFVVEFVPEKISELTDEEMRACQISRQKTRYLRELSLAILDKRINLHQLQEMSPEEVRKQLTAVKGIGHWTADIYLMFCLQDKDVFPAGDIAVVNTIKELLGITSRAEMILCSEKWKPYRSLATFFLWHYYLNKRGRNAAF